MASTEVEKREQNELAPLSETEQALADAVKGQIDRSTLVLPALKLTQSLTAEVQNGDVQQGHFINSLTAEDYGDEVQIVISSLFAGRFYSDDDGNSYVATGAVAPDNWPEEYAGQAFEDIPDAEEQWKIDTNEGKHEWGKGAPISTTTNFVGYVVTEDGLSDLPVRLSLMRSGNNAAKKLKTLLYALRAPWDKTFVLKAKRAVSNDRPYFVVDVASGDRATDEIRQAAVSLAQDYQNAAQQGNVELAGDEDEQAKPARGRAKKDSGGLDV